jgi:putative Holliday junction resolvase
MSRILAIDYGQKRVGLAVTDILQIIATSLDTVHPKDVIKYIAEYVKREPVELFVVGFPKDLQNKDTDATKFVEAFIKQLDKAFPDIPVEKIDERFTSKIAFRAMIDGGMKKSDRRNKSTIDKVSAVIILQSYLEQKQNIKDRNKVSENDTITN